MRGVPDIRVCYSQTSVGVSRREGFGIIYYIFANSSILRYIHLRSIAKKHENDNGDVLRSIHSFTQTEMLSSAAVIPIPFLSDNYSYLIVDRQSKTAAVVDPSDPISALGVSAKSWRGVEDDFVHTQTS